MKKPPFWLRFTTDPAVDLGGGSDQQQPDPTPDPAPQPDAPDGDQQPDKPLGPNGEKALKAERDARHAAEKALADAQARVKEFEQAQMSEQERLSAQLKEAQEAAATASAEALRLRIAAELNVPADLHEFLTGASEDEIRAKAQKLAAMAQQGKQTPRPDFGGGKRGDDPSSIAAIDQRIAEALKAGNVRESIQLKKQRQELITSGAK